MNKYKFEEQFILIKKIGIKNVKGIGSTTPNGKYEFDLYPNKPNIFVAPNGFGKSSFLIAFKSLNTRKIKLEKNNYFENNEDNKPSIKISYLDNNNEPQEKTATDDSNEINDVFDWFVINNQVFAKAKKSRIGGTVIASASLETPPFTLVKTIPDKVQFQYSIKIQKDNFGRNSKILSNISGLYKNKKLIYELNKFHSTLGRISGQRVQQRIGEFIIRVNSQNGTREDLLTWIEDNELETLNTIPNLFEIVELLKSFDLGFTNISEHYLSAIQIACAFNENQNIFKSATKWSNYELEKEAYKNLFKDFNSSWKSFEPKEKNGSLIIEIPQACHISNGERDIMCFIALLKQAEMKLSKQRSILIIDEIFDYLDDANLIAAQYYVTKLIKKFKNNGKMFFPIILTHLNPYHFKNYTFSKQKIFFLEKKEAAISPHFRKILINRDDQLIKDNLSRHHLHFNPTPINIRPDFETLNLKPTWGDSSIFETYINDEFRKYSNNESIYDPFAVCCAVRKKIEEFVYNKLENEDFKEEFIEATNTTPNKLDYADSKGVIIPETYYLLGIIYNDGLHWKDNESAIAGKLEHLTIRKMISEI